MINENKTIQEKADRYYNQFVTAKRIDGTEFVHLKEGADDSLHNSIHEAHGTRLPNDWIYKTYMDLLGQVADYDLDDVEDFDEVRDEMVENCVDTGTWELTHWLADNNNNVYYINEVLEQENDIVDGFILLSKAQYIAVDEIMSEVINLLSK